MGVGLHFNARAHGESGMHTNPGKKLTLYGRTNQATATATTSMRQMRHWIKEIKPTPETFHVLNHSFNNNTTTTTTYCLYVHVHTVSLFECVYFYRFKYVHLYQIRTPVPPSQTHLYIYVHKNIMETQFHSLHTAVCNSLSSLIKIFLSIIVSCRTHFFHFQYELFSAYALCSANKKVHSTVVAHSFWD